MCHEPTKSTLSERLMGSCGPDLQEVCVDACRIVGSRVSRGRVQYVSIKYTERLAKLSALETP